jgi:hypothetical protein
MPRAGGCGQTLRSGAVGERRSQFGEALRADAEGLGKTDALNLTG